jgi:hypothetical protein
MFVTNNRIYYDKDIMFVFLICKLDELLNIPINRTISITKYTFEKNTFEKINFIIKYHYFDTIHEIAYLSKFYME